MKKNVLITGGSRGIGAALVRHYCKEGYRVCFLYNNSEKEAQKLQSDTGALAVQCNVSNYEDVKVAVENACNQLGIKGFQIVICNAAISYVGLFDNTTNRQWQSLMETNVNGVFFTLKETASYMISEKYGKIVIVSSMWGQVGAAMEVAYSTTKAALIGLTKSLAKELAPSSINVNCVAPGFIMTDMNSSYTMEEVDEIISEIPLGKQGSVDDVVHSISFLTKDQSEYITGHILHVNGGLVI